VKCAALNNELPSRLEGLKPRVVSPSTPLVHAWGDPAVVATCGVPAPRGYSAGSSETTEVDGIRWFQQIGSKSVTWTALRPGGVNGQTINVRLVVPVHYAAQGAFLVDLAPALKAALHAN